MVFEFYSYYKKQIKFLNLGTVDHHARCILLLIIMHVAYFVPVFCKDYLLKICLLKFSQGHVERQYHLAFQSKLFQPYSRIDLFQQRPEWK